MVNNFGASWLLIDSQNGQIMYSTFLEPFLIVNFNKYINSSMTRSLAPFDRWSVRSNELIHNAPKYYDRGRHTRLH